MKGAGRGHEAGGWSGDDPGSGAAGVRVLELMAAGIAEGLVARVVHLIDGGIREPGIGMLHLGQTGHDDLIPAPKDNLGTLLGERRLSHTGWHRLQDTS